MKEVSPDLVDVCKICGLSFSEPSMGGPGICPMCDCGIQPVAKQRAEIEALRAQMREARELLRELTEPAEVQEQTRIFNDALAFLQLLRGPHD